MPFLIILLVLVYKLGYRAGPEERAAMIRWLREILLLNILLVP